MRLDVEAPGRCLEDGSVCIIVADCGHSSTIGELELARLAETRVWLVWALGTFWTFLAQLWPRAHTEAVHLHLTTVTGTAAVMATFKLASPRKKLKTSLQSFQEDADDEVPSTSGMDVLHDIVKLTVRPGVCHYVSSSDNPRIFLQSAGLVA